MRKPFPNYHSADVSFGHNVSCGRLLFLHEKSTANFVEQHIPSEGHLLELVFSTAYLNLNLHI